MIIIAAAIVGGLVYVASTSDSVGGTPADATAPHLTSPPTTARGGPIEETEEYIRSTEVCPPELRTLDAVPVANFGIALEPFLDVADATAITFVDAERGFVGDRTGRIWSFDNSGLSSEPVIDLSNNTSAEDDQGLLGLTLGPRGAWLYLNHTDGEGDSVIRAYPVPPVGNDSDSSVVNDSKGPVGGVEILVVDQPSRQHNGGSLAFGPDGYLYVSFGDGGGLGDPRHNGQDLGTVLGSILRLAVDPTATPPYRAAPGNPYLNDPTRNNLIWASGIRNPFRLSFDRVQGDLWIADVGQQCLEEVNMLTMQDGGANLGWNVYEGTRRFVGDPLRDHHEPVYEYKHGRGLCAVIGGYVYRGRAFPELLGRYMFSDLCDGKLYALNPGGTPEVIELPLSTSRPVGFGQDPEGELYVIDYETGIHRLVSADSG